MNFPDLLARQHEEHPARSQLVTWLLAVIQAPNLDEDLAAGVRPSASRAHQLRADHLGRRRVRHRIATALNRAVTNASQSNRDITSQAPLRREAVRRCSGEIRDLARLVATMEKPPTRGVAIASQLAFDGRGALFFKPEAGDGFEQLANTVDAARRALRVSPDL
jgi:hypothetical protein